MSCRACGLFCGTCDAVYHTVPSRAAHVREAVVIASEIDALAQEEAGIDESAAQKAAPRIYCDDDMVEFATVFWCVFFLAITYDSHSDATCCLSFATLLNCGLTCIILSLNLLDDVVNSTRRTQH